MKKILIIVLLSVMAISAFAGTTFTVTTTTTDTIEAQVIRPITFLTFAGSVDVIVEEKQCRFNVKHFRDIWENIKGNRVEGDWELRSDYKHVAQNIYIDSFGHRYQIDDVRNNYSVKNAEVESNCSAKQTDQTFWEQNK